VLHCRPHRPGHGRQVRHREREEQAVKVCLTQHHHAPTAAVGGTRFGVSRLVQRRTVTAEHQSQSQCVSLQALAPRAKVVQTVVCSTFARKAKPATRRVADSERMNPGTGCWSALIPKTASTWTTSTYCRHPGSPAPDTGLHHGGRRVHSRGLSATRLRAPGG